MLLEFCTKSISNGFQQFGLILSFCFHMMSNPLENTDNLKYLEIFLSKTCTFYQTKRLVSLKLVWQCTYYSEKYDVCSDHQTFNLRCSIISFYHFFFTDFKYRLQFKHIYCRKTRQRGWTTMSKILITILPQNKYIQL